MIDGAGTGASGAPRTGAEPPAAVTPRAFLRVGGATVAQHQLALCVALECQRLICVARGLTPELVALQHAAEAAGMQFHVVAGARQTAGLITANDELVVLSDGLLAAPSGVIPLLEAGHGMLVQPVETGVPLGFERMDINHAFAGAMRIPGRLVERLSELPPDCDVASALTRIALQAGVAQRPVPIESREGVSWRIVRDESEAHAIETGWIDLHMQQGRATTLGTALARLGVRAFGPALLHAGSGGNALAVGAGVFLAMALVAGWFGAIATALVLTAVCWIVRQSAELLDRIERDSLSRPPARIPREVLFGWLLDAVLIVLVTWSVGTVQPRWPFDFVVAPLFLVSLLRIAPQLFTRNGSAWLEDRALLCILLAVASAAGALIQVVTLAAGLLALAGALLAGWSTRITRA
jgi:hypothetical protein